MRFQVFLAGQQQLQAHKVCVQPRPSQPCMQFVLAILKRGYQWFGRVYNHHVLDTGTRPIYRAAIQLGSNRLLYGPALVQAACMLACV